jgi:ribosome maturation factor RimP
LKRGQAVPSLFIENFQMEIEEEIRKIAEEKLIEPGLFVVEVVVSARGTQKVIVIIDGDQGVTIDDCATLSRELSKVLDDAPLLNNSYLLEVSTPGLDQPLKLKRQYSKNIGRKLRVKLKETTIEGKLTEVTPEKIMIEQEIAEGKKKEIKAIEIQFSEIDKSFVLVSFK